MRRKTDPSRAADAINWMEEGLHLARDFEGSLGGGVLQDSQRPNVLYVLYRFADQQALDRWESSPTRQAWLKQGEDLVLDAKVQRRTGMEGWFDGAKEWRSTATQAIPQQEAMVSQAPRRWKQAVAIALGMYPLNVAAQEFAVHAPWWADVPLLLRALLLVSVMVPLMTFVLMPLITRLLKPWLSRHSGVIRKRVRQ